MTDESTQTPETPQAPPPPQVPPPPQQMAPPPPAASTEAEIADGKIFAFLAYFLGLIGVVIVLVAKKDNRFAVYHAKQALVMVIVGIASGVIAVIPILGWIVAFVVGIALFIFWIMGIINALNGKEQELPIIGKYAEKFNF